MHYKQLHVWQKGMDLIVAIYKFTSDFPTNETYGLTSQMRRAAVSIPSNVAEGSRRRGKDGKHFLNIAYGSGAELETQLEASRLLNMGTVAKRERCESLLSDVMRMLNKMVNSD
jgi:four helix bundle protein